MMTFETFKGRDNKYYFQLVADSGKILLLSKGYGEKDNVVPEIESLRNVFISDNSIEKKATYSGLHFFNIKGSNGLVKVSSTVFDTPEIMGRWLWKIKKEVSETRIMETIR